MSSANVKRIDPNSVTFAQFFREFLLPGQPCLINAQLTDSWPCRSDWVTDGSRINFDFLRRFGDCSVPVVKCSSDYGASQVQSWQFHRYLDYLQSDSSPECLYLKDWHFAKEIRSYQPYRLPSYFQSDWLNEYCDSKDDPVEQDFRFVYIGKKSTWTPYHSDVVRSYSWSTNIVGKKLWYLSAPGLEHNYAELRNEIRSDVSTVWKGSADGHYLIEQGPGETIFIPSGWFHQVHNLEDTISVNHNWLNVTNVEAVRIFLISSLVDVEKEIEDCRDADDNWSQQCQLILKANVGMNIPEFCNLLCTIATNRLRSFDAKELKILADSLKDTDSHSTLLQLTSSHMVAECVCSNCWELCDRCRVWLNSCDILAVRRELINLQRLYQPLLNSLLMQHTIDSLNKAVD